MARPAPIPPDLDDDNDEIEATPEDLAPPAREEAASPHAQTRSAPDTQTPGGSPDLAPAAGNITPAPTGSNPTMTAQPDFATKAPRTAGRRHRQNLGSILFLIALALFAAALSAAVVLVLF